MIRHHVAELVSELQNALDEELPTSVRELERSQVEIIADLVDLGPEAVDAMVASFTFTLPKVRIALFTALGRIGTWPAIVAMMRFVFEKQGDISTAEERGFAMRAIAQNAGVQYQRQLSDFTKDIAKDDDRWVIAFRLEIIGKIKDLSQIATLELYTTCDDTLLREKATEALFLLNDTLPDETLRSHSPDGLTPADRRWINNFRYASPERRAELDAQLTPEGRYLRLSTLATLDTQGASLALQWIVANGRALPETEVLPFRKLAEDQLVKSSDDGLRTVALQAIRCTLRKTQPPCTARVVQQVDRAVGSEDSLLRQAAVMLIREAISERRRSGDTPIVGDERGDNSPDMWDISLLRLLLRKGAPRTVGCIVDELVYLDRAALAPLANDFAEVLVSLPFYIDSVEILDEIYTTLIKCYLISIPGSKYGRKSSIHVSEIFPGGFGRSIEEKKLDTIMERIERGSKQLKLERPVNQSVVEKAMILVRRAQLPSF